MKWAIYATEFSMMHEIYEPKEEVVATFDNKKDAEFYIKSAKLKTPGRSFHSVYRQKSILSYYEYASVGEYEPEYEPPHNPEINW